jgi:methylated-DNA-[protein]-cysteine S-methyltransferase
MLYYDIFPSVLGPLYIVVSETNIQRVEIGDEEWGSFYTLNKEQILHQSTPLLEEAMKQIHEYFEGNRQSFELPLAQKGTAFQQSVWKVLRNIPYGETISYLDVANQIENPKAVRAVGQANRANPLPIIVPCHRVIGKNKQLTGYAGNKVDLKEMLLTLEGGIAKG